jgi:phage/plasmid-like protein (TIGR03299 family)
MTGEEMLKVAKLDWKVQRRALAMRMADGQGLLSEPLSGYRAIVRADTDEVFQVATNRYYPLQNQEIVEFFREYCEAGHAEMETVGAIDGGRKVWALAKLNGTTSAEIGGQGSGDQVTGYMLLATSHDGSLRTIGKPTQVRVVCWNTLSASLGLTNGKLGKAVSQEFRMKHSRKWTPAVAAEARKVMGMAVESIARINETADKLARVKIDQAGRIEFVKRLVGGESLLEQVVADQDARRLEAQRDTLLDSIIGQAERSKTGDSDDLGRLGKALLESMLYSPGSDLPSARNTMWGAVNGVTYYADHEQGRTQDTRLSSAWFGPSANLKAQAVQVAMDMSGLSLAQ